MEKKIEREQSKKLCCMPKKVTKVGVFIVIYKSGNYSADLIFRTKLRMKFSATENSPTRNSLAMLPSITKIVASPSALASGQGRVSSKRVSSPRQSPSLRDEVFPLSVLQTEPRAKTTTFISRPDSGKTVSLSCRVLSVKASAKGASLSRDASPKSSVFLRIRARSERIILIQDRASLSRASCETRREESSEKLRQVSSTPLISPSSRR